VDIDSTMMTDQVDTYAFDDSGHCRPLDSRMVYVEDHGGVQVQVQVNVNVWFNLATRRAQRRR